MKVIFETSADQSTLEPEGRLIYEKKFSDVSLGCVIPCYKCEEVIPRAILSATNSDIPLEIVVVIDQEETRIVEEIASLYGQIGAESGRLRVVTLDGNWGLAVARNVGVSYVEGEYFFTLDADNKVYGQRLGRAKRLMEESRADFGIGPLLIKGATTSGLMSAIAEIPPLSYPPTNFIDAMAMYRKSSWNELGRFRPLSVQGHEDYDFWVRAKLAKSSIASFDFLFGEYFVRPNSMIRSLSDELKQLAMDEIASLNPNASW